MYPPLSFFFLFLLFLFFNTKALLSQARELNDYPQVTAGFYVDFLNSTARVDFHGVYDETMQLPANAPRIFRTGAPGYYHYFVFQEEENLPLSCMNAISAVRCYHWLEKEQYTEEYPQEAAETGVYGHDQECHDVFPEEGDLVTLLSNQNSDPSLLESIVRESPTETTMKIVETSSPAVSVSLIKQRPLTRKALKGFTGYFCPILGMCLGLTAAGIATSYLSCSIPATIAVILGSGVVGLIAGIAVTDVIWSQLNAWLGPPS